MGPGASFAGGGTWAGLTVNSKGEVLAMMAGQDSGVKGAVEGTVVLRSAHGG